MLITNTPQSTRAHAAHQAQQLQLAHHALRHAQLAQSDLLPLTLLTHTHLQILQSRLLAHLHVLRHAEQRAYDVRRGVPCPSHHAHTLTRTPQTVDPAARLAHLLLATARHDLSGGPWRRLVAHLHHVLGVHHAEA